MIPLNLLCKIGSYLPIKSVLNFLLVSKKINCDLFWRLYVEKNYAINNRKDDSYYMQVKLLSLFPNCVERFTIGLYKKKKVSNFNEFQLNYVKEIHLSGIVSFQNNYLPNLEYLYLENDTRYFGNNYAPKLEELIISPHYISQLDLSPHKELRVANLSEGFLVSLYILENHKLGRIDISSNPIKRLSHNYETIVIIN